MERRVTSHTEEEEMNQRRQLLTRARKGDQKAIDSLFELYQVRVFSGEALKKKKLPSFPVDQPSGSNGRGKSKGVKKTDKVSKATLAESGKSVLKERQAKPKKESNVSSKSTGKASDSIRKGDKTGKRAKKAASRKTISKSVATKKTVLSKAQGKGKKSTLSARARLSKKK